MAKQLKEIEIPFGAKDSELCGWEYTIPEGMEATIVDNKIVVKKKESENEKIRKAIIKHFKAGTEYVSFSGFSKGEIIAWLEHKPIDNDIKEALHTEYEKGRADAFAEMQKPWSEVDEYYHNIILYILYNQDVGKTDKENAINWFTSLKERYNWKPNDEQLKALLSKLPVVKGGGDKVQDILESLYKDLNKLK